MHLNHLVTQLTSSIICFNVLLKIIQAELVYTNIRCKSCSSKFPYLFLQKPDDYKKKYNTAIKAVEGVLVYWEYKYQAISFQEYTANK